MTDRSSAKIEAYRDGYKNGGLDKRVIERRSEYAWNSADDAGDGYAKWYGMGYRDGWDGRKSRFPSARSNPSLASYGEPEHVPVQDLRVGDLVLHNPGKKGSVADWYSIESIQGPSNGLITFLVCKLGGTRIISDKAPTPGVAYARRPIVRSNPISGSPGVCNWGTCTKKGRVEVDGRLYCREHALDAVAAGKRCICANCPNCAPGCRAPGCNEGRRGNPRLTAKCPECHRVFDLLNPRDAAEWSTGHDCERPTPRRGPASKRRSKNPSKGMPGMPYAWITKDGIEVNGNDLIEFQVNEGPATHPKWVRRKAKVNRMLIFDDHVQVNLGWAGTTVDDSNFIRIVRKAH